MLFTTITLYWWFSSTILCLIPLFLQFGMLFYIFYCISPPKKTIIQNNAVKITPSIISFIKNEYHLYDASLSCYVKTNEHDKAWHLNFLIIDGDNVLYMIDDDIYDLREAAYISDDKGYFKLKNTYLENQIA